MAFVDRVTALRPSVGQTGWGDALNTYLAAVESALENLETAPANLGPYAANVYERPSQTATLPGDLPDGTLIIVPLDA